jgi:hypothetical protein
MDELQRLFFFNFTIFLLKESLPLILTGFNMWICGTNREDFSAMEGEVEGGVEGGVGGETSLYELVYRIIQQILCFFC